MAIRQPNSYNQIYVAEIYAGGTDRCSATPLSAEICVVTQCPPGAGVVIPDTVGVVYEIVNRTPNALLVYPPFESQIERNAANVAVQIAAGDAARFVLSSEGRIYAI